MMPELINTIAPGAGWIFAFGVIITSLATAYRARTQSRKTEADAGSDFRDDLMERVKLLEARVDALVKENRDQAKSHADEMKDLASRHAKEMKDLTSRYEAAQKATAAQHDAAIQLMRHRLANEVTLFDSMLMWIDHDPSKLADILPQIRADREERARNIALESGEVARAKIDVAVDDGRTK